MVPICPRGMEFAALMCLMAIPLAVEAICSLRVTPATLSAPSGKARKHISGGKKRPRNFGRATGAKDWRR